ncbi:hypothetical protein Q2T42_28765 [Leptolyngbya boryana CZ1]|uniref:Uncharacterized protein n=1 Tax=Leptolyngbya boryana CZ1 TaxID=3060204 RepID=A0AA97APH1_LEPBY|nr:hypothetical protein [Leptolyngbya boryana]WNZ45787.1 hypothetical protein Q2T42_28765 [Leptolyngbya boryana CZ1]
MKRHFALLPLTAALALGSSACLNIYASAPPSKSSPVEVASAPPSKSNRSVEVAQNSNQSVQVSHDASTVSSDNSQSEQIGGLSPSQQASLKSLGIEIAVPSAIPAGYTVIKVDTEPCPENASRSEKGTCRFGPQYGIVYRNAEQNSCFAIEATGGGVGGVPREYAAKVKTELLGETSLLFGQENGEFKTPSAEQLDSPQPNLLTDWAGVGPFYRISGGDTARDAYYKGGSPLCQNTITPNQAIEIMQSITWLN